jgi:hypothetical protein
LPDAAVRDIQITATLPSGEIQPILWLHGYDPSWQSTFRLASGMHLPAGTVIEASAPLRFVLKTAAPPTATNHENGGDRFPSTGRPRPNKQ